jgi:hypothetical protein
MMSGGMRNLGESRSGRRRKRKKRAGIEDGGDKCGMVNRREGRDESVVLYDKVFT